MSEPDDKPLEKLTKRQLREFAEKRGMSITYAAQRSKPDLIKIIRQHLRQTGEK